MTEDLAKQQAWLWQKAQELNLLVDTVNPLRSYTVIENQLAGFGITSPYEPAQPVFVFPKYIQGATEQKQMAGAISGLTSAKEPFSDLTKALAAKVTTENVSALANAVLDNADSAIKSAAQTAIGIALNPETPVVVAAVVGVGAMGAVMLTTMNPSEQARIAKYRGVCEEGQYLVDDYQMGRQCVPLSDFSYLPSCKGLETGDNQIWGTYEGGFFGVGSTYYLYCGSARNSSDDSLTSVWTNAYKAAQKQRPDPTVVAAAKAIEEKAAKKHADLGQSVKAAALSISKKAEEQLAALNEQMQAQIRKRYNAVQQIAALSCGPDDERCDDAEFDRNQADAEIERIAGEMYKIRDRAVQDEVNLGNKAAQAQAQIVEKTEAQLSDLSGTKKTALLSKNKAGKKTVHFATGTHESAPAPKVAVGPTPTAAAAINAANGHSIATQVDVQQQHLAQQSAVAAATAQQAASTVANNPTAVVAAAVAPGTPAATTEAVNKILKDEQAQHQEIVTDAAKTLSAKSAAVRKLVLEAEPKLLANKLELDKMAALPGGRRTKAYQAKKKELEKVNVAIQEQVDKAVMGFIQESTGLTAAAALKQLKLQASTEKRLAALTKKSNLSVTTATAAKVTQHAKGRSVSKPRGAVAVKKRAVVVKRAKKQRCAVGSRAKVSKKTGKKYCRRYK